MKKYILILLTSVVTLSSCSDWFDVTSGSEIREKDHYSVSEEVFRYVKLYQQERKCPLW